MDLHGEAAVVTGGASGLGEATARALAKAGAKVMGEGIRVNTILPGILGTPMLAGLPQNVQDSLAATVPFPKRLGRPEEYADAVLFLVGNGYMNGATLRLDGALRMAPR